jgi:hypothetical protein
MRKLSLTLSAAVFVLGALALPASAQNEQRGAASIHAHLLQFAGGCVT